MTKKTLITVLLVLMLGPFVLCAQAHTGLYPLLVDLPGWSGEQPEGMSMDTSGMKLINAAREYTKGASELTAAVIVGNQQMAQAAKQAGSMNIETDKQRIAVKQVRGYTVQIVFDKQDRSGAVTIVLAEQKPVLFTLVFEGISDDEAMSLAERFDWNAIKRKGGTL